MHRSISTGIFALILLSTPFAGAQSGPDTAKTTPDATTPDAPAKITHTETVTVTASGEDRDEQSIDQTGLIELAPGTSPIEALSRLPSVEVTTADPYGAYEWALRINVRGFNQNQLGFTLDDVPLGDMSYGNLNGLHISRALIDENMGKTTLSQGTGALETATNSNLGGTVQFYSTDPATSRRFTVNQMFGSWNGLRTFARFDSGLMGGKTAFFIDGVYQRTDKWKGAGPIGQNYYQFNTKLTHQVGTRGLFTFYADYSNRREVDYQDLNKVWDEKLGYKWDNYGNWAEAIQAAYAYDGVGSYPSPVSKLASNEDQVDAAYYGGGGIRKDLLTYVNYKTAITNNVVWKTTLYGHDNSGRGLWFTPYLPTYDASYTFVSPISLRTSEYGIDRGGFVTSVAWDTGRNKLEGGAWFEDENFDLARKFYGTTVASPVHSLYDFPSNPFYTQWAYTFRTTVYQLHLQDAFKVTPRLTVSAGFKTVETNTKGKLNAFNTGLPLLNPTAVASNYAQGSLESGKPFLPQFGANYKFNKSNEVFGDVAYNVRAYQAGGPGFGNSPWGTSQTGFNYIKTSLKPESSWSEEAGYRLLGSRGVAQVNYFHVNFSDRLLAIQQGAGIAGNASLLSNVGGVTTNGVDGSGTIQINPEFSFYNALTWSKSTYDSDVVTGGITYPTKSKVTVDSPEILYKDSLEYDKHGFGAHIGADYMGKRYFTYTDDNSVDGRFLADFGLSYSREQLGLLNAIKVQFNIYNLADAKYYSSIGTNGFILSDPTSVSNNTLQVGAPRTLTGQVSFKF